MFLHSFGHNKNLWFPQLTHFADRGFRVIAPDMPGHGESSFDPANHTVDAIGQMYGEFLERIGVEGRVGSSRSPRHDRPAVFDRERDLTGGSRAAGKSDDQVGREDDDAGDAGSGR